MHSGRTLVLTLLAAALALTPAPGRGADGVATVLGEEILRAEIAAAGTEQEQLSRLYDRVWRRVAGHYIQRKALAATASEVAELAAYDREFAARDRAQRTRKLAELDQRLEAQGLQAEERAHLEEFRAVLRRLAGNDAENDRLPPPDPAVLAASHAQWVEMWKMNRALYQQYGGVVALTWFGPFPHGARVALIADYERQGLLAFADGRLREQLYALLEAAPAMVIPPERVDFTPYWKRPIPPSYFPD